MDGEQSKWTRTLGWLLERMQTAKRWLVGGSLAFGRMFLRLMKNQKLRSSLRHIRRTGIVAAGAALLAVGLFAGLKLAVHRIPPGFLGVSQARFGTGLGDEAFSTSLVGGLFKRWHHLDSRSQEVRFAWESEGGSHPVLDLVTRDGEKVSVAAGVLYAIMKDQAHRLVADGLGKDFGVRAEAIARRVLMEEFQILGSLDWFDPSQRQAVSDRALERLRSEYASCYLAAEDVLVSAVYFPSNFEAKRIQLQLDTQDRKTREALARRRAAELTLAEAQAAHDEALARKGDQWGERLVAVEIEAAAAERQVRLDAARDAAQTIASAEDRYGRMVHEGELALDAAKSLRETLDAGIWSGPGGSEFLAREAARKLTFGSITLDPSDPQVPSPFDLDRLSALLIGSN